MLFEHLSRCKSAPLFPKSTRRDLALLLNSDHLLVSLAILRFAPLLRHSPFSTPTPRLFLRLQPFTRSITVMPLKASKRKVDADSDAEVSSHSESGQIKKPAAKKSKAKEPVKPLDVSLPHNTAFPKDLQPFPAKAEGSARLSAWNVCGIKACDKKVSSLPSRRATFRTD